MHWRRLVDSLNALRLQSREIVLHLLQPLGGMALPRRDLARDPERLTRTIRLRRIAGELLVRQVGVILNRTGWLHDVDSFPSVAGGHLGTPDRRIQSAGQVDPGRLLPRAEIGSCSQPRSRLPV